MMHCTQGVPRRERLAHGVTYLAPKDSGVLIILGLFIDFLSHSLAYRQCGVLLYIVVSEEFGE
jgi:hypothetical protein